MHKVRWVDYHREPKEKTDPWYPNGIDLDLVTGEPFFRDDNVKSCKVDLPYPAKRCGIYMVKCQTCGCNVGVTTAGRPDDPKSVRIPCKTN
jgi:hypothetical protein